VNAKEPDDDPVDRRDRLGGWKPEAFTLAR